MSRKGRRREGGGEVLEGEGKKISLGGRGRGGLCKGFVSHRYGRRRYTNRRATPAPCDAASSRRLAEGEKRKRGENKRGCPELLPLGKLHDVLRLAPTIVDRSPSHPFLPLLLLLSSSSRSPLVASLHPDLKLRSSFPDASTTLATSPDHRFPCLAPSSTFSASPPSPSPPRTRLAETSQAHTSPVDTAQSR